MERKWLLLFKGDVVALSGTVQKTLFEQYIFAIHDMEELLLLDDKAVRQAAAAGFWQACKIRFHDMKDMQIADQLRELAIKQASRAVPSGQLIRKRSAAETLPLMLSAWDELSLKLQRQSRLRKRLSLLRTSCMMAVILVFGGLLFGIVAQVTDAGPSSPVKPGSKSAEAQLNMKQAQMIEWKAGEPQAKQAANINMISPSYLPPGYAFLEGMAWLREGDAASDHYVLTYTNEQQHLLRVTYFKLNKNGALSSSSFMPQISAEELHLRGARGILSKYEQQFIRLDWTEEEAYFSITGRELDDEQIVQMAKSLK
jgi:hypothetical protein